jgi:hypothetical protein
VTALRIPAFGDEAPMLLLREATAGMPAGTNTLGEIQGHPIIVHWEDDADNWRAASIQVYPPGALADSLARLLREPRLPVGK